MAMEPAIRSANGVQIRVAEAGPGGGEPVLLTCPWPESLFAFRKLWDRLAVPVFVANGESDPMIQPRYSYLLAGLIPHAQIKLYPDSAHGFLFQHHQEFAADVAAFLDA